MISVVYYFGNRISVGSCLLHFVMVNAVERKAPVMACVAYPRTGQKVFTTQYVIILSFLGVHHTDAA
jgi:hypothetical protein